MALSTKGIKDAVENRAKTIPNITVWQDEVPDLASLPTTANGVLRPYVVLYFAEPFRAADGRGIVTTRHDVNVLVMTAQVHAPDKNSANSIIDQVRDKFTGWKTTDTGEFFLRGGASRSSGSNAAPPIDYIREASFETRCNLSYS